MSAALRVSETGESTGGMLPALVAYIEYCEGRHEFAHQLLDQAISESKTFGVVTHLATFYRAVTMKTAYRMWEGAFNVHPEDCQLLRALSAIAIQNGDSEGETLFAIPTLANLLIQDRFRDAESWVVLIERFIMPKARLMNLLVIHGTLSLYYAKTGDHEKTRIYVELLGQNIQNQGVGAHPFPLMGCMFAVMAMYTIYGSALNDTREAKSLYGSSEPQCPFNAEATLNHLVAYLKTEPLKSLAEPFICLAEAIRCFLIQDERGGSLKLEQGFRELGPGLEGITFVKAYFLAQLGRHSSPEQKRECYKEARQLFQSMSMDPLIWLPDLNLDWRPSPVEAQFDYILGDVPLPAFTERFEEGSLGWAVVEVSRGRSLGTEAEPEASQAVMRASQDPTIGLGDGGGCGPGRDVVQL
jgi:hypothetical protein